MHYYQHHIGDFIRDTSRLNNDQCMAYLRLLWIYYDTEKPLIDDPESLAFQIGADEKDVRLILSHFFRIADGMRTHKRCDEEIALFHSKSEKARVSANARWRNATAMRTHNDGNAGEQKNDANQQPITKNQEPPIAPDGFAEFWKAYPKKTGKIAALKAWKKVKADVNKILCAVAMQKESVQWRKDGGQFIPNPATWLNEGRWDDEPTKSDAPGVPAGYTPPKVGDVRKHPTYGHMERFIGDRWVLTA